MNYCGYGQHFVVEAAEEEEARELVSPEAEDYFYEQDSEQLEEDGIDEGPFADIKSVEPFDESHEQWQYYQDPEQRCHYIEV